MLVWKLEIVDTWPVTLARMSIVSWANQINPQNSYIILFLAGFFLQEWLWQVSLGQVLRLYSYRDTQERSHSTFGPAGMSKQNPPGTEPQGHIARICKLILHDPASGKSARLPGNASASIDPAQQTSRLSNTSRPEIMWQMQQLLRCIALLMDKCSLMPLTLKRKNWITVRWY